MTQSPLAIQKQEVSLGFPEAAATQCTQGMRHCVRLHFRSLTISQKGLAPGNPYWNQSRMERDILFCSDGKTASEACGDELRDRAELRFYEQVMGHWLGAK